MRIAALDDKIEWLKLEQQISEKYCKERDEELQFQGYDDVTTFFADLQEKVKYDIYLLDVEMPVADGLQVATEIKKICAEPIIIYITDFPQYAPRGYEVNAFRYILKEQIEKKLPEAYDSLMTKLKERERAYYIYMKNNGIEQLLQESIYYIKKDKKYVMLYTENGEKRERKSLQEIFGELSQEDFMFIDKGLIVNIRHVMKLDGEVVKMRNGECFLISRPRQRIAKQKIMEYWGKRI